MSEMDMNNLDDLNQRKEKCSQYERFIPEAQLNSSNGTIIFCGRNLQIQMSLGPCRWAKRGG